MSADQQADLFREMSEQERTRLLPTLHPKAQEALQLLLRYPPESAGGIMTTEFLSVPATWTVDQTLQLIHKVGGAKEMVYAVYVVDPARGTLRHVVSLRELVLSDRGRPVAEVGPLRKILSVSPRIDREDVARIISKYDLLAVPVVDADGRILGIVTVDDVIDALVAETTEDVQKFGGMEALDEPYMEIGLPRMLRKRAGWLAALFIGEMLTATAMGYFEHEIERAVVLALFVPLIISSGGQLGIAGHIPHHPGDGAGGGAPTGLVAGGGAGTPLRLVPGRLPRCDRCLPHPALAVRRLVRLRIALPSGRADGGGRPRGRRDLRIARRVHAPVRPSATGFDPASASAPFVATLVDVTGLVIYFSVGSVILRGTLL
jgi:magnesium transporter